MVTFHSGKTLTINREIAGNIKRAIKNGSTHFEIGNNFYAVSGVSYVEQYEAEKFPQLPEKTEIPVKRETLERIKKELKRKPGWENNNISKN